MEFSIQKYFKHREAVAKAYSSVFSSDAGKTVLRDLMSRFGLSRELPDTDPVVASAWRAVVFYVLRKIGADEKTILEEIHRRMEERVLDGKEDDERFEGSSAFKSESPAGFFKTE